MSDGSQALLRLHRCETALEVIREGVTEGKSDDDIVAAAKEKLRG